MMENVSHLLIEPIVSHVPCERVLHLQAIGTPWNTKGKQVLPVSAEALHRCAALVSVHRYDPEIMVFALSTISLVSFPDAGILLAEFVSCLLHRKVCER